jgi:hypothetical protein
MRLLLRRVSVALVVCGPWCFKPVEHVTTKCYCAGPQLTRRECFIKELKAREKRLQSVIASVRSGASTPASSKHPVLYNPSPPGDTLGFHGM